MNEGRIFPQRSLPSRKRTKFDSGGNLNHPKLGTINPNFLVGNLNFKLSQIGVSIILIVFGLPGNFRISKRLFSTPELPPEICPRTDAAETAIDAARDFLAAAKEQVRRGTTGREGCWSIYSLEVKNVYIHIYQYIATSHINWCYILYILVHQQVK